MNYKRILHTLGIVLCFEAAFMILPLICAIIYKESEIIDFIISISICLIVGTVLALYKGLCLRYRKPVVAATLC